jgi:hypothetical protein
MGNKGRRDKTVCASEEGAWRPVYCSQFHSVFRALHSALDCPTLSENVRGPGRSAPQNPVLVLAEWEGLIVPLAYGLQGLMQLNRGKVRWAVDSPTDFVRKSLPDIAGAYQLVLEMAKWIRRR